MAMMYIKNRLVLIATIYVFAFTGCATTDDIPFALYQQYIGSRMPAEDVATITIDGCAEICYVDETLRSQMQLVEKNPWTGSGLRFEVLPGDHIISVGCYISGWEGGVFNKCRGPFAIIVKAGEKYKLSGREVITSEQSYQNTAYDNSIYTISAKRGYPSFTFQHSEDKRIDLTSAIPSLNIFDRFNLPRSQNIFNEEFNNDNTSLEQLEPSNPDILLQRSGGTYAIEHKRPDKKWQMWFDIPTNNMQDFIISTSIEYINGSIKDSYGLLWGKDSNKYHYLVISENYGSYSYGACINGTCQSVMGWLTNDEIKNNRYRNNQLTVFKSGKYIVIAFNDLVVNILNYDETVAPNKIGIQVYDKLKIEVDRITFGKIL